MSVKLAPSLLSADFGALRSAAELISPDCEYLHVDVMDGQFVPNLTIGPPVVASLTGLAPLDIHLMVRTPERLLADFARAAGADATGASDASSPLPPEAPILNVHVEACPHLHGTLQMIRSLGCRPGVTLNPGTPVSAIEPVLDLASLVLVMSVNPGFAGQRYIANCEPKLARLALLKEEYGYDYEIEVDGGITVDTIKAAYEAGAEVFVAGSAIFGKPEPIAAAQALRAAAEV